MQRTVVMAQRHGAQRDPFHRALDGGSALDVFADTERVLG